MQELWEKLGPWAVPLIWMALSAIVNAALHYRSAEEWAAWAAEHQRLASVVRLLSALGVDPAKALKALVAFVRAKAGK